jgi:DNA-binding NarL/FixJ family response regulator
MLVVLVNACEQRFGADGAEIATFVDDTLRASFGTERVYVPAPSREGRNRAIKEGVAAGRSVADVAREHGVTTKTVRRIVRR